MEQNLFKIYTDYKPKQLILTGTPNLDLYVKNTEKQTDITFMLTWRPWDLVGEISSNSYIDRYLHFIKLINKLHFAENVNVILHPKAREILTEQFPDVLKSIEEYLYEGDIKEALMKSKVLITDYSSICFMHMLEEVKLFSFGEIKKKVKSNMVLKIYSKKKMPLVILFMV